MFLRSLALSKKLFAALLLPVALVIGFLGLRVADAASVREAALTQLDEAERFEAVNAFADAVAFEDRQYFNFLSDADGVASAREDVDARLDDLLDTELDIDVAVLQRMVDLHAELLAAREVLGEGAASMRTQAQLELIQEMGAVDGTVLAALGVPGQVYTGIINAYQFDQSSIGSAEQAALLNSYTLVQDTRSSYSTEVSFFIGAVSLPADAVTNVVTEVNATNISDTDKSLELMRNLATPETIERVDGILAGEVYSDYAPFRDVFQNAEAGSAITGASAVELTSVAASLDAQFTQLTEEIVEEIRVNASAESATANRQLLESIVLGALTLVVMSAVLAGLYLSIRNPLRKLTTRSTEIAEVELPSVVSVMRTGDGTVPEITELRSATTDEIGELTDAFNGMYRTAVELAAEQAASRRVVADMFVNLGRRNQKLLNRMLKGLGQLEQEEQDPDTLGALYKVDQLATRMRRNAESLLILAGAGQSRTFNRDVSLYEVIQSALSEVEDFQRVDVVVDSELQMDGHYVADVAHLLAELIENALLFSPPSSTVEVITRETSKGLVVAVADQGVGMPQDSVDAANARILSAAKQTETPSEFLGHYVVGRLAERHGVEVKLVQGAASGTVARVVLPAKMFANDHDMGSLEDLGEVSELSPASPFAEQGTAVLPEIEPVSELELAPSVDEQFAPAAEFDAVESAVEEVDPSVSPFGNLRRGGPVDTDSPAPVAEFDAVEPAVEEVDPSVSPFGNLRRGGPVEADAPASGTPIGDPLLPSAVETTPEVDEFTQRDSLDAFTAGVRLADEVDEVDEADEVEVAADELDAADMADEFGQRDSLDAFTAGVRLADEADQVDDVDAADADADDEGIEVAAADPVAMLDWAQVDSDLMLDGETDDVVDVAETEEVAAEIGAGEDAEDVPETVEIAELDDIEADVEPELEVTSEDKATPASISVESVPSPVLPETGDILEVTSDFGSPAGERIPLPQVDARRPLYEPSVDFGARPRPAAEPVVAHTDHDDDQDHSDCDIDHVDADHVDADHVDTEPEFAMSAATAAPDADAETSSPFAAVRRDPGASLPVRQRLSPAAASTPTTSDSDEVTITTPDDVRSSLSGFQTGVVRAEKETH